MLSIVPSADIAAILLLCAVFVQIYYALKVKSASNTLFRKYQDSVEYFKSMYEREEKRKWEVLSKVPHYEFILGNKETGWVWMEMFEDYPKLNIGDKVKLIKSETEEVEVMVEKFNGVRQFKDYTPYISFNVSECK